MILKGIMLRNHLSIGVRQWGLTGLLMIGLGGCNIAKQISYSTTPSPLIKSSSNTVVDSYPLVITTNAIICGLAQRIAANTVNLKCLVATDDNQLRSEDVKVIEQAKLILYNAHNLAPDLSKLVQTTSNSAPKVAVDIAPNFQQSAANDNTNEAVPLQNGSKMAEAIAQSLSQLKPNQAPLYAANTQKLTKELALLDSWNQSDNLPTAQRQLVEMHQLETYLNPTAWPNINAQARLAKVPVIMYHDILPKKEVFFDVTPEELEQHLRLLQESGFTPISLDQLVTHLRTGLPLPIKPILLTFDDGYGGHYQYVYPLIKKYGYPAVFSIYTSNVGKNTGRTHVTWEQLRQMIANPLVTIASHSVTHPLDLRPLSNNQLQIEVMLSKRILESQLGIPIRYFTYPAGKYDARVTDLIRQAGYEAALTMNDAEDRFAGESKDLLAIDRIGQSSLQTAIASAWGGPKFANADK